MHSVLDCLHCGPLFQTGQQTASVNLLGPHSWFQVLEIIVIRTHLYCNHESESSGKKMTAAVCTS